jgi:hypothetical protein
MFKKKRPSHILDLPKVNTSNYYDSYKVGIVVDGVVEAFVNVSLGTFCAFMSNPTFIDARLSKHNIGDKVDQ